MKSKNEKNYGRVQWLETILSSDIYIAEKKLINIFRKIILTKSGSRKVFPPKSHELFLGGLEAESWLAEKRQSAALIYRNSHYKSAERKRERQKERKKDKKKKERNSHYKSAERKRERQK